MADVLFRHPYIDGDDLKDQDPTPRGTHEPWRFTPSIMDPNSFAFTSFANQLPGYYTPTPGGTNTLYHNQAGDLHTPGFSLGLGTPLSLPTSENSLHAGQPSSATMHPFAPPAIAPHVFHTPNPFAPVHDPQAFAPHHFSQTTHFEPMHALDEHHAQDSMAVDVDMQERSPVLNFSAQPFDTAAMRPPPMPQPMETFRYHVTLNAPTAMIKHANEIPVTYLNKGQAYTVSIIDTTPLQMGPVPPRYRTFVRISFEDDQQRQRPGACWQLWKEGRGMNEAHHRGGRLQAVEFVDPSQVSGGDVPGRPRIEIESSSFDGFCVTWSPPPNQPAECSLAVRFNFLSTDFSHSKGVKGIPVRLTAKTQLLGVEAPASPGTGKAETCYCKVKLFRDHGAERKLSNDVAHVKKTIDKLKQQIAQIESGLKDVGKRKRSGSMAKTSSSSSRPGKVPKHKRTWSMSSASSQGNRGSAEEDLQVKLQTLQDMFTSTRPVSVLYLKGEEGDDPDLHPVHLTGETATLTKIDTTDAAALWERQSSQTGGTSSMVSPTPSAQSLQSNEPTRRTSGFQQPTPFGPLSRVSSNEWRSYPQTATADLQQGIVPQMVSAPDNMPTRVPRPQMSDSGSLAGWIEAIGVDQTYQPPVERVVKPIACFYFQPRIIGQQAEDNYYRAVYLMQRTAKDLVQAIATKCNIEPTSVLRTIMYNKNGLPIYVDDDFVREMPEGQDMVAEFSPVHSPMPRKREWDAGPTDIQVDGDIGVIENVNSEGFELKLLY